MSLFLQILSLIGGLAMFLFGMKIMGQGLEKRAGNRLKGLLEKLTASRFHALLLGTVVTALLQSSSAVTVMAVGFVNSGLMSLEQVTGVIFGANLGTTLTAWLLSLTQLNGAGFFLQLLKPSFFTPILSLIGVLFYLFSKKESRRDVGGILLGFSLLMFGMERMSEAVQPLSELPAFREVLLVFQNPFLGVLAGMLITALLQSSTASIGILQALSGAGQLTVRAAIPIVMGQNIGTCVTTLLSSIGTEKNAKRTAFIHLYFNVIGTAVLLLLFYTFSWIFDFSFAEENIDAVGIAAVHTSFNVICTALLFPFGKWLEKLAIQTVPDGAAQMENVDFLDKRLLTSPALAVERSRLMTVNMAKSAIENMQNSFALLFDYDRKKREKLDKNEARVDRMEDEIGNYLIAIGSRNLSEADSIEVTALLHLIVNFERIADHAVHIAQAAEHVDNEKTEWDGVAEKDLRLLMRAVEEITALSLQTFEKEDREAARKVEPLEQVIDELKNEIMTRSILRLQENACGVAIGFLMSDILNDLERIAAHCSNIAGIYLSVSERTLRVHDCLDRTNLRSNPSYRAWLRHYRMQFCLEDVQKDL